MDVWQGSMISASLTCRVRELLQGAVLCIVGGVSTSLTSTTRCLGNSSPLVITIRYSQLSPKGKIATRGKPFIYVNFKEKTRRRNERERKYRGQHFGRGEGISRWSREHRENTMGDVRSQASPWGQTQFTKSNLTVKGRGCMRPKEELERALQGCVQINTGQGIEHSQREAGEDIS